MPETWSQNCAGCSQNIRQKVAVAKRQLAYLTHTFLHISHHPRCSLSIFCLLRFTQPVCDSTPLPWFNPHLGINQIDHLKHSVAPYTDNDIFHCAFSSVCIATVLALQIVCDKHESPCTKTSRTPPYPDPGLVNL